MAIRYAETYDSGLVVPPPSLDCIGEDCPVAAVVGHCFTDPHHFYFPKAKYLADPLYGALFNASVNQRLMPRCRHNSRSPEAVHSRIDDVPLPPRDVVVYFLKEMKVLERLHVVVNSLRQIEEALTTPEAKRRADRPKRSQAYYDEYREERVVLLQQAAKFEVVPPTQMVDPATLTCKVFQFTPIDDIPSGLILPFDLPTEVAT